MYLSPYEAQAHLLIGRIHLRGGRPHDAIDALKISIWSEDTAAAHVALAEAYLKTGDTRPRAPKREKALVLDPASADAKAAARETGRRIRTLKHAAPAAPRGSACPPPAALIGARARRASRAGRARRPRSSTPRSRRHHPPGGDREFIRRAIARADAANAALLVFMLRTPGGLVDSTRDIITAIIAAKTPVAVFVGPSGSRAASAGFLITIAADVAAMAPGTHIGAAHPVAGTARRSTRRWRRR